jgi:hypothetical protein
MQVKLALLQQELPNIDLAAQHLGYCLERCAGFDAWHEPTPEQLERLESMSARFVRLSDILIQRIFRLIDDIELVGSSTVLDRIYRAEKRGWAQADQLIKIRELRNLIAHEYATDAMPEIYAAVMTLSPSLLDTAHQIENYTNNLLQPNER